MSTAAPEPTLPALSEPQRLLCTFADPARTMADLRRNASWWVPWLLISIVSIAFAFTLDQRIGWGQVLETQLLSNPKAAQRIEAMPAAQQDKMERVQETTARIAGYASPLTVLLWLAVMAGLLMAVFNFGFGERISFRQMMAVSAYGSLPTIISSLLSILVLFFVSADTFDIKNPLASSVGYFVPNSMPFWKAALGAFDVFVLWQILLLAIGVSQLGKVKRLTAFATIFGLYFALKLIGAGISLM